MTASERSVGLPPLRERIREQTPIWFAFYGGPVAWGIRLGMSYMLVPVACRTETLYLLHAVAVVTIGISLAAAFVGYRTWDRARQRRGSDDTWERDEFLGIAGIFLGILFAGVIVLESTANFIVDPCLAAGT
jgi:hypothetical protein